MPAVFFAIFKIAHVYFSVITMIHFEPTLVPSIALPFCSTTNFCLVVLFPLFTAGVVCPRSAHTDEQ